MRNCPQYDRNLRCILPRPQKITAQLYNRGGQWVEKTPPRQPHLERRSGTLLAHQICHRCGHQNRQVRPRVLRKILNDNIAEIASIARDWQRQIKSNFRPWFRINTQAKASIEFVPIQRNHRLTTGDAIIILCVIGQRHDTKRRDIGSLSQRNARRRIVGHLHCPTAPTLGFDHDLTRSGDTELCHCSCLLRVRHNCGFLRARRGRVRNGLLQRDRG